MRKVPRPDAVERLASLLLGNDDDVSPLPPPPRRGVLAALERVLLGPLQRTPCVVSFSGGRDSSAVLAVTADVARRHGLPLPVPVIMRFPNDPQSEESAWQELVLDHLGLAPEIVHVQHELDALGDVATEAVGRLGVRWPANAYLHAPVLERARGGSLLTGVGGDELLGTRAARVVFLSRGRALPRRSDLREVPGSLRSRRAREAAWVRDNGPRFPWLTPEGEHTVHLALAREETAWPHRWDRSLTHWHRSRAFSAVSGLIGLYAERFDVQVTNPLLDPAVLAELRRIGGATGFGSRTAAMKRLFGGLLPAQVLARETKAGFNRAVFGPAVRAFAREWDGIGVDERWVDVEALRDAWLSPTPDFRSIILLHQAWSSTQASASST
jgi:hypothetical protein